MEESRSFGAICNLLVVILVFFTPRLSVFHLSPGGCRDVRLGRNGANEVKTHAWFRNDSWTWDNIRQQVPPVVPELSSDVDTQYFDVIDDEKDKPESFSTPRVSCCQHQCL